MLIFVTISCYCIKYILLRVDFKIQQVIRQSAGQARAGLRPLTAGHSLTLKVIRQSGLQGTISASRTNDIEFARAQHRPHSVIQSFILLMVACSWCQGLAARLITGFMCLW